MRSASSLFSCQLSSHFRLLRAARNKHRAWNERVESSPELLAKLIAFLKDLMLRTRNDDMGAVLKAACEAFDRGSADECVVCGGDNQNGNFDALHEVQGVDYRDGAASSRDPSDGRGADRQVRRSAKHLLGALIAEPVGGHGVAFEGNIFP